jgi:hypothetical protein
MGHNKNIKRKWDRKEPTLKKRQVIDDMEKVKLMVSRYLGRLKIKCIPICMVFN